MALHSGNLHNNDLLVEGLKKLIFTYGKNTVFDCQQIKNSFITESLLYIEQNYHTKIKLDDLATMAKQSKYSFIRQFKKNVGITPFEYVNLQRIKQGKCIYEKGYLWLKPLYQQAFTTKVILVIISKIMYG